MRMTLIHMMKHRNCRRHHQTLAGFTLLEVILALGLGGLVLSTLMTVFVSFVQVWNEPEEQRSFFEHVENCTRILSIHLNDTTPLLAHDGCVGSQFTACKCNLNGLVLYGLAKQMAAPFLFCEDSYSPCAMLLGYDKHQLFWLWQGRALEQKRFGSGMEETQNVVTHKMILSECIKEIQCAYLDLEKGTWRFADWYDGLRKSVEGKREEGPCPEGLSITFEKNGWEEKRFVPLLRRHFYPLAKPLPNPLPNKKEVRDEKSTSAKS